MTTVDVGCVRSGGQDGPGLVDRFREVVGTREVRGEVVNLNQQTDTGVLGPRPALLKYSNSPDIRIIGKARQGHER